jgi:3-oxoacyl-[acyl-carrier-protein] synthase-3
MAHNAVGILGTGSYVPKMERTNDDLATQFGVTPEWIERKTRIRARRYAAPGEAVSDLAVRAGKRALRMAGVTAEQLDYLIVATGTGDHPFPPTSCLVQAVLKADNAACFDINIGCSGFVYGVAIARALAAAEPQALILVIAADIYSRFVAPDDVGVAVLLGDGAGAAVLGAVNDGTGIIDVSMRGRGDKSDLLMIEAGGSRRPASLKTLADDGHYVRMKGRDVTAFVLENVPPAVRALLARAGVESDEIRHFVPHQANGVILERLAGEVGLAKAQMHVTVDRYGNMGAASVAVTLDHANHAGCFERGELTLLCGFGGGMALGNCLLRWTGQ